MKKYASTVCLFIAVTFIILCSCEDKKKSNFDEAKISGEKIVQKKSKSESAIRDVINFGVTPWQDEEIMKNIFNPLLEYLAEKTKYKFVLNISPDYRTLKNDFQNNSVQIAMFSSSVYGEALTEMKDEMKYIATVSKKVGNEIHDFYIGCIFTRKDAKINSINDLKEKTFGFVDRGSSSGYKYPVALLLKQNIMPEKYFKNIYFLGSHDKVVSAVANKSVDAGATAMIDYNAGIKKYSEIFKIIKKTSPIPYDALVAQKDFPDEVIKELQNILISIPTDAKTSAGNAVFSKFFTGFVLRNNEFYNIIIETTELLNEYENQIK